MPEVSQYPDTGALCPVQRVTIDGALMHSELAGSVHPAVLQLGLCYADGSIRGGNACCVAMLTTFRKLIQVRSRFSSLSRFRRLPRVL